MDKLQIVTLLLNSGLKVFGMDNEFIYFEDPSCIFPAFDTIFKYASITALILTAIMLLGWGALYIKNGVKINSLFHNAKSLILIFAVFGMVKPIMDFMNINNLFARHCDIKHASIANVMQLVAKRDEHVPKSSQYSLYENFVFIDSNEESVSVYDDEDDEYDYDYDDDEYEE